MSSLSSIMPSSPHLRPFLATGFAGAALPEAEASREVDVDVFAFLRALRDALPPGPALAVSTWVLGVAGRELFGVRTGVASAEVVS